MSNWTHVAAIARIDDLRSLNQGEPDFDKIFGRELRWGDDGTIWDEADEHPERFLPLGSEGSLQKSVWINSDRDSMDAYTVSIFGDLRNHDDPDEIIEWFKDKCKNLWIRNAAIVVQNEWNGTREWHSI